MLKLQKKNIDIYLFERVWLFLANHFPLRFFKLFSVPVCVIVMCLRLQQLREEERSPLPNTDYV